MEQGIEPEDVARFALETKFMNTHQLQNFRALGYAKGGKPITRDDGSQRCIPTHANAVRMKDGSTVELNPWVELP